MKEDEMENVELRADTVSQKAQSPTFDDNDVDEALMAELSQNGNVSALSENTFFTDEDDILLTNAAQEKDGDVEDWFLKAIDQAADNVSNVNDDKEDADHTNDHTKCWKGKRH